MQQKGKFLKRWAGTLKSGGMIAFEDLYLRRNAEVGNEETLAGFEADSMSKVVELQKWKQILTNCSFSITTEEDLSHELLKEERKLTRTENAISSEKNPKEREDKSAARTRGEGNPRLLPPGCQSPWIGRAAKHRQCSAAAPPMCASTVFFCGAPSFRKTRGALTIFQRMTFVTTGRRNEILAKNGPARRYWSGMKLAILYSSAIRRILRCCFQAVPASFPIPSSIAGVSASFPARAGLLFLAPLWLGGAWP
jgi:hypothetical protein